MTTGMRHWLAFAYAVVAASVVPARAWQTGLTGNTNGDGLARDVAIAPDGDVVVGGFLTQAGTGGDFVVVRLAATDGTERWRTIVPGPATSSMTADGDEALAVTVDANGDVVAAGLGSSATAPAQFTTVKLAGSSGALLWGHTDAARAGDQIGIALAGNGDVYVADSIEDGSEWHIRLTRRAADTGLPLWIYEGRVGSGRAVAVRPDGDPVVLGIAFPLLNISNVVLARVDQATGMEKWNTARMSLPGLPAFLRVAAGGDVYTGVGPWELPPDTTAPMGVSLLSGETGTTVWTAGVDRIDAATVLPTGDIGLLEGTTVFSVKLGRQDHTVRVETRAQGDGSLVASHDFPVDSTGGSFTYYCPCGAGGRGAALVLDPPTSDLFVVASYHDRAAAESDRRLFTARLAGGDLHELWRKETAPATKVPGPFDPQAGARGADGSLVVAGASLGSTDRVFSVVTFAPNDGAPHACGDGAVDAGEVCDDGTAGALPCCAADCHSKQPDGTACDDASVCTLGDHCAGGLCTASAPLPCEPCGTCDATQGCVTDGPRECRHPTITHAAAVTIARPRSGRARFAWTMRSGPDTAVGDLGNPLDGTGYALCGIQDRHVLLRAVAPAGACPKGKCWRRTKRGFTYVDRAATDGIARLALKAGPGGRSRFAARGAGARALLPTLPAGGPLRVELRRLDDPGVCWAADHGTVKRNTPRRYRAVGG